MPVFDGEVRLVTSFLRGPRVFEVTMEDRERTEGDSDWTTGL